MKKKIIIISLLLTGCMVGPKIEKPAQIMPSDYSEKKKEAGTTFLKLDEWWKHFDDKDLDKYINIAIANNYDLKVAIQKIEEARYYYQIKTADLFPEVHLTAQAIRQQISPNAFGSRFFENINQSQSSANQTSFTTNQNFFQFGFDAIWELDFFGKLRREKQAAFYAYLQEKFSMLDVYITLLSDVAKAYMDIITIKNKILVNERKLFCQNKIFELTQQKYITGLDSEISEKEQAIIIENIKQDIINLTTSYKTTIHKLAVLLGREPENLEKEFKKEKFLPEIKNDIQVGLPSELLRRRPDIRIAENYLYQQIANVGVSIAKLFPSFSLIGSFDFESSHTKNWFRWASRSWSIGPTFDFPFLDFGRRINDVRATKAAQKQALFSYKNTILLALEDVENALVVYFHEKDNLASTYQKLNDQKKITFLKKDLFKSGLQSEINYLEYELMLLDVENQYIDQKRNVNIDLISLIKALGGGW